MSPHRPPPDPPIPFSKNIFIFWNRVFVTIGYFINSLCLFIIMFIIATNTNTAIPFKHHTYRCYQLRTSHWGIYSQVNSLFKFMFNLLLKAIQYKVFGNNLEIYWHICLKVFWCPQFFRKNSSLIIYNFVQKNIIIKAHKKEKIKVKH